MMETDQRPRLVLLPGAESQYTQPPPAGRFTTVLCRSADLPSLLMPTGCCLLSMRNDCGSVSCEEANMLQAPTLMARGLKLNKASEHLTVNESIGSES